MNITNIIIDVIKEGDYKRVYEFQCEYLDQESYGEFHQRIQANPDLYLGAFIEGDLAGICYGDPSERDKSCINLQGIAVSLDETKGYARKGIGSRLLKSFEEAVKQKGYKKIGVGSADDKKVESFYLKNGFLPIELVAKGQEAEEYERVKVIDYESGLHKKQDLYEKYQPFELIFIFEKNI